MLISASGVRLQCGGRVDHASGFADGPGTDSEYCYHKLDIRSFTVCHFHWNYVREIENIVIIVGKRLELYWHFAQVTFYKLIIV